MDLHKSLYNNCLVTVVTEVLDKRKAAGQGAATLDEIYKELLADGCEFVGKNEGIKKRGLVISMGKNQKFHRLPNETWGLTAWYPGVKESKETNAQIKDEKDIPDEVVTKEKNTNIQNNNKKSE